MRIVDGKVIVCSPGRNFVTLKLVTEDGVYGARRRDAQRPRAGGRQLPERSRPAAAHRPRRAPHRGHLAVPLQGRVLAARSGDDDGDCRGRHRALGHPAARRSTCRCISCSAARRATRCWSTGTRTARPRTTRRGGAALHGARLPRRSARSARFPASLHAYGVGRGDAVLRAGAEGHAARERVEHRALSRLRAAAVRAAAARVRLRRAPAPRRAPSADADRSRRGSARASSRTGCSGWRIRCRRRTRRRSA